MLRVATWNVNSIRSRRELVFMWLERVPVEILCLQELKTETHNFPFLDFERLGYKCYVHGQKTYNGVAICSKFGLEDVFKA
jgi:Exodeoxyribonuclease III (EC 3.1.11.2)